jgi:predicted nucleotidyltransferase
VIAERHGIAAGVVSELKDEFGNRLLAVILTGSLATTTGVRSSSDIDIFAIVATEWFQRRWFVRDTVEVDLFVEPRRRLDILLRPGGNVAYVHALAGGVALFDRNGTAEHYIALARFVHGAAAPRPTAADIFMVRLRARSLIDKIRELIDTDALAARYVLVDLAAWAPQAAYSARGGWTPSTKAMMRGVTSAFPDLYQLLVPMLDERLSLGERLRATEFFYCALLGDDLLTTEEFTGPQAFIAPQRRVVVGDGEVYITDTRPR